MSCNKFIPPFRRFVIENFPFIENDFDALNEYQLLCKIVEYLNKVIGSQNEVTAQMMQLQDFVTNYFDNLDVQEEINNKLDEMALDGTLQEIITTYIESNVTWTFDTVADMKSATNLIAGSYARTLGFYSINDGGGALYYITDTGTANEKDTIAIGDLYAKIVITNSMCVAQFGAKGDGVTDDADSLVACFTLASNVKFMPNVEYLSSKNIVVANSGTIDLNGSKISMYNRLSETTGVVAVFRIEADFTEIKNGELHGDIADRESHSQRIYGISTVANNIEIHNMKIYQFDADGITGAGNNIAIYDCEVYSCGRNNISILYGNNVSIHDVNTHNCVGVTAPGHGIDIEPYADEQDVLGLEIYNITGGNNYGSGVNISFYDEVEVTANVHDIFVDNPMSIKTSHKPSGYINVKDISISGDLIIQDPVSTDMKINIENITIRDYTPATTTSFWGAAVKIRSNVSDTSYTSICNLNIKNLKIDGGTPTRCIYIDDAGHAGTNNIIDGIKCNINTISPVTGSGTIANWNIKNIESDYVATVTSAINAQQISTSINLNGDPTLSDKLPYGSRIKIINATTSKHYITSQGNNQYGNKMFGILPKTECYITLKSGGDIQIESDKVVMLIAAAGEYTFNICDTNFISSIRSTHYNINYVDYDKMISIAADSGTGVTLSLADGVLSVTGHETAATYLYLMK